MSDITLHLTAAELEALKRAFPDLSPADAATALLRAEMRKRYRRELKAGRIVSLEALKRVVESG